MHPNTGDTGGEKLALLEEGARAALADQASQNLSDEEWRRARTKLLSFAGLVTGWVRQAQRNASRNGNVAILRKVPERERGIDKAA